MRYKNRYWRTQSGESIKITDMTDLHLRYAIRYIKRLIDSCPGEVGCGGDGDPASLTMELENLHNTWILEDLQESLRWLEAETKRRMMLAKAG